jgi:hypothetical protein
MPLWKLISPLLIAFYFSALAVAKPPATPQQAAFPREIVDWTPRAENPVLQGSGPGQWDAAIRERGWILRDGDEYRLWYSGYDATREGIKQLGYATSRDGLTWTRSKRNPLCPGRWIEDMMVVRDGVTYFMFAEGPRPSEVQMLTSPDGLAWTVVGVLDIRTTDGRHVERPFGTPTVWLEDGRWHLFYERADLGVWLATTEDPRSLLWTNIDDEPVLKPGPAEHDSELIAVDQIIKHRGVYYAYYHASGRCAEGAERTWNTNIARSRDLRHWEKYSGNPIIGDNKSSGIVVPVNGRYRLYTMHDQVDVFESPRD